MIGRRDNDRTTDGSDGVDADRTAVQTEDRTGDRTGDLAGDRAADQAVTDRTGTGRHADQASGTHAGADVHSRMTGTHDDTDRHQGVEHRVVPARTKPAKTSAAAVFGLVFGLAALFCALTGILAPVAILLGVIGLLVSIAGFKMTKRLGVTGKGVALGGLLTSLLGLALGAAVLAGAAAVVNDEARLDQLQNWLDDARENAPSTDQLRDELPG